MDIEIKRCQEDFGGYIVLVNGKIVMKCSDIDEAIKYAEAHGEKVESDVI